MLNAGTALKSGFITPQMALDWCEEYAPGASRRIHRGEPSRRFDDSRLRFL